MISTRTAMFAFRLWGSGELSDDSMSHKADEEREGKGPQ